MTHARPLVAHTRVAHTRVARSRVARTLVASLIGLASLSAYAAEHILATGGTMPAAGNIATSDTVTLTGDVTTGVTANLAAKSVIFQSDDPDVWRTITGTSTNRLFQFQNTTNTLTFDHVILSSGTSTATAQMGGAIWFNAGSAGTVTIKGAFAVNNNWNAGNAGGIQMGNSLLILEGPVSFAENYAGGSGGGINIGVGSAGATFNDTMTFVSNTAAGSGGAIGANNTTGNVTFMGSSTFVANVSGAMGGAIYSLGTLKFGSGAYFSGNSATLDAGGAIYARGNTTITGPTLFTSNTAGANGGAIFLTTNNTSGNTLTLDASLGDITFENNIQNTTTAAAGTAERNAIAIHTNSTLTTLPSVVLNTGAGADAHTISFLDPIDTTDATAYAKITQTGDGLVIFDAFASAVTATTTIDSGVFRLSRGAIYGTSDSIGDFTLASAATLSGNGAVRAGIITLAANAHLEVLGGGTLSLQATTLSGNGLHISGNGAIDAGSGAGGTLSLSVSLVDVGALIPDDPQGVPFANFAQTLTFAPATSLMLEDSGTIAIDLFSGGASDRLIVDTITLSGTGFLNLIGVGSGTFNVMNASADISASTAGLKPLVNGLVPAGHFGATKTYQNSGKELWIEFATQNLFTTWTGGDGGVWKNTPGSNLNWDDGGDDHSFINGDGVTFGDTAANKTVIIDGDGVIVAEMTAGNTAGNDYTFTGSGGITTGTTMSAGSIVTAPTGKLVKTDGGALNFENAGANTFVGGVEISGGTLGFTAGTQLGDGGNGIRFTGDATLRANAGNATLSNKLIVDAARTAIIDTAAHTLTYDGDLAGIAATGTLAKTGSGVLRITTDNSAIAAAAVTHVREGTLSLDTAAAKLGGRIDIAADAILAGIGSATGDVYAAQGAIIQPGGAPGTPGTPGAPAAPGTLTLHNLDLDNSILRFDLFGDGVSDSINLTGALSFTGANVIDISAFVAGAYNLGNIAQLHDPATKVTIAGIDQVAGARQTGAIAASGADLMLITAADMSRILQWTGTASAIWTPADDNWTDGGAVTLYAGGDRVIFDDTAPAASPRAITIAGSGVTVSDIQIQGTSDWSFAGAGITADTAAVVSGSVLTPATAQGKLVKAGSGTLAFTNAANNFKGGIELGGGAITFTAANQLDDGGNGIRFTGDAMLAPAIDALTLAGNIAIDANTTATIDTGAGSFTLSGTLSSASAGTLAKINTGTLTLSGNSAATTAGLTVMIGSGELHLDDATLGGEVDLAPNATLSGIGKLDTASVAAGGVIRIGAGELAIANLQLAAGATLTSDAVLSTLSGGAVFGGLVTADIALGQTIVFSGTNTGMGSVLKTGYGRLVYNTAGALAYTGSTQINQGVVVFDGITGADATAVVQTVVLNGGHLWLNAQPTGTYSSTNTVEGTANDWSGLRIVQGAGPLAGDSAIHGANEMITVGSGTIDYNIRSGIHVVVDAGSGVTVFSNTDNAYWGVTRIDSGTLQVTATGQIGNTVTNPKVILNGGALQISADYDTARALELRADGSVTTDSGVATTWGSVSSTGGDFALTKLGSGTFTNSGANTAAALNVSEGRYVATRSNGAGAGLVTVASDAVMEFNTGAGTAIVANTFAGAGTLAITGGANTFSGTSVAIDHIIINGAATNITSANGLPPVVFGNPAGTILIDAARFNLGAPATTLGNVTLASNATLGFVSSGTGGASFKTATVGSLAGSGTLLFNTNLARSRNDRLTILTAPAGDYALLVNNTGPMPENYGAPLTLVDAPAGGTATFSAPGGKIDVGLFSYAVTTGTENGSLVVRITGTGAMSNAGSLISAMAGALPLSWFSELDTASRRMGELHMDARGSRNGVSTWVRTHGQQLDFGAGATGLAFDELQFVVDGGIDYKLRGTGDTKVYVGGFFGYGQSDRDFGAAGDSRSESIHGGLYETITSNGWYLDGILKINGFANTFTAYSPTGESMTGDYNTYAIGGSLELGKRIDIDNGWYVVPQIQGAYAQLIGKRYATSSGIAVELCGGSTAQGRVGFAFGRLISYGGGGGGGGGGKYFQVCVKASGAAQWTTGGEIIATPAGGAPRRHTPTIKGDRIEGGLGFVWKPVRKQFQIHFDFETAEADDYYKPWGLNFGIHCGW
ncbi:MAG: autotransporter outer membrane beta-barrel domain-containing protein [Opitutaceae bacterium]|jgi:outer membrane autotransporter protein|nr:autotransporter outer membrane beta-barrel domain-containing protein [Opitutaceae bacterium]